MKKYFTKYTLENFTDRRIEDSMFQKIVDKLDSEFLKEKEFSQLVYDVIVNKKDIKAFEDFVEFDKIKKLCKYNGLLKDFSDENITVSCSFFPYYKVRDYIVEIMKTYSDVPKRTIIKKSFINRFFLVLNYTLLLAFFLEKAECLFKEEIDI